MSRERRVCPLCQGEMEYRLGEYECIACNYRAPRETPQVKEDRFEQDDGIKRRKLIRPPSAPGQGEDYVFSPQDYDTTARVKVKDRESLPSYTNQKLAISAVLVIQAFLTYIILSPQKDIYAYNIGEFFLPSIFIGMVIGLALWIWALFCNILAVKYIFIVLSGLNVLSVVASIVFLIYATNSVAVNMPGMVLPVLGVMIYITLVLQLLMTCWMFFLFYKDIEALNT